jgi:hypothetical protein
MCEQLSLDRGVESSIEAAPTAAEATPFEDGCWEKNPEFRCQHRKRHEPDRLKVGNVGLQEDSIDGADFESGTDLRIEEAIAISCMASPSTNPWQLIAREHIHDARSAE